MSRRLVLARTTLLAVVVLALVAMVGAYTPRPHESRPAARIAPVAHVAQTAATLETTTLTVVDIDANRTPTRSYTAGVVGAVVDGE